MRRRLRSVRLGFALVSVAAVLSCGQRPPGGVLLITIDTCRADRIGCYGGPIETVAIDALAAGGVLFRAASAPTPLTAPSHASLLTGLYPDRHGVRDNGSARLPDGARTLAEILGEAGFRSAAFVSAFPLDREFGMAQGFDFYADSLSTSAARGEGRLAGESEDITRRFFYDERSAEDVAADAIPWLREAAAGDAPFFAWVHFFDPHAVYQPPPRFATRYGRFSYEGEIAYVDEQIGRLLEALGDRRDVLVCVTADHGESLGEHGEATHGLFVYQSTMHVPCVLAGPGVPAGKSIDAPVSLVDLAPTLLELLGISAMDDADGESLVPLFRERRGASPRAVFGENLAPSFHYGWAGLRWVREDAWRFVDAPTPELFDLSADPGESRNLAGEHPELVARMRERIERQAARGGAIEPDRITLDAAARERLERLGYVGGGGPRRATPALAVGGGRDPKDMVDFFNRLQGIPTLLMDGRLDEAERELLALRAADSTNTDVLQKLALVARNRGDWPAARDWSREALRLSADDTDWRMNLAIALVRTGDREGARAEYREVLLREPDHVDAWVLLGDLFAQDGRFDEALVALDRAAELDTTDARIETARGGVLIDLGREDAGLSAYGRAIRLSATASAAVNAKALALSRAGRPEDAVRILRRMMPALEKDVETLNNLAWILANASIDPAQGLEFARRARELSPDDAVILDTFGWAAVRAGRAGEAVEPLERAWKATEDPEVRGHLAAALHGLGRVDEARAHARAALAARPALANVAEIAKAAR